MNKSVLTITQKPVIQLGSQFFSHILETLMCKVRSGLPKDLLFFSCTLYAHLEYCFIQSTKNFCDSLSNFIISLLFSITYFFLDFFLILSIVLVTFFSNIVPFFSSLKTNRKGRQRLCSFCFYPHLNHVSNLSHI